MTNKEITLSRPHHSSRYIFTDHGDHIWFGLVNGNRIEHSLRMTRAAAREEYSACIASGCRRLA